MGLNPTFTLYTGDKRKKIPDVLHQNITSITITDKKGNEVDELSIDLAGDYNQDSSKVDLVSVNTVIEAWLGYSDAGSLYNCGTYTINSVTQRKGTAKISATSLDLTLSLKQKRTRAFKSVTIKYILQSIAKYHGLKIKTDINTTIKYLAQTSESDLNLLQRLSKTYNAIFAIKNKTIIFIKEEESLPVFLISSYDCIDFEFSINHTDSYNSVRASWRDTKHGVQKTITIGDEEPTLSITGHFQGEEEARANALSSLLAANSSNITGRITLEGFNIPAGSIVLLQGFGYQDQNTFIADTVEHSMSTSSGYIISVYLSLKITEEDINTKRETIETIKIKRKKRVDHLKHRKIPAK